jgi:mitochondrial pyruvate carrier 2
LGCARKFPGQSKRKLMFQQVRAAFLHPQYGWKTTHFWGPMANWGIVGAGVYDLFNKGPEKISMPMTSTLSVYSLMFMRFAWMVKPRNYLLLAAHACNFTVQTIQLGRKINHEKKQGNNIDLSQIGLGLAIVGGSALIGPKILEKVKPKLETSGSRILKLLIHPAGPFTVFFWAPTTKWALSGSNIVDYKRDIHSISIPQQIALTATGLIWTRYSFVINPINLNLAAVNTMLSITGIYQLSRIYVYDPFRNERGIGK